jgi:hypothetical protein
MVVLVYCQTPTVTSLFQISQVLVYDHRYTISTHYRHLIFLSLTIQTARFANDDRRRFFSLVGLTLSETLDTRLHIDSLLGSSLSISVQHLHQNSIRPWSVNYQTRAEMI